MEDYLYTITEWVAKIHQHILSLNDSYNYNFSDKQLHFLVIGALGMLMVFVLQPIFVLLAKRGHTLVITWLYVVTVLTAISFAIEIGQRWTGTGTMDFADIMAGMYGFFLLFAIFALIRAVLKGVWKLITGADDDEDDEEDL